MVLILISKGKGCEETDAQMEINLMSQKDEKEMNKKQLIAQTAAALGLEIHSSMHVVYTLMT